ncbi:MAG TPA: hypothetical protein VG797_03890 [Phycisphaerales bacterium]|nr:hypothetical protein [Phycisphaerales bacterium]
MRPIHDPIIASIAPTRRAAPLHLVPEAPERVHPSTQREPMTHAPRGNETWRASERTDHQSANRAATIARDIARENRSASLTAQTLTDADARLIFTRAAAHAIEGGRAALIRPETRKRLLDTARRLGIRPFDAHLSIAVVQDRARRGEPIDHIDSFAHPSLTRCREREHAWHIARTAMASAALAVLLLVLLIRWVGGTH